MTQEILFRYFKGLASPEEEQAIGAWLLEDPQAGDAFREAQFLFEGMTLYAPEEKKRKRFLFRTVLHFVEGIAAAVLLAAATGLFVHRHTVDTLSHEMMVLATPPGERVQVTLSDGTLVTLNADSRIDYPVTFEGAERRVKIQGEALFQVTHDEARPFIVSTFATDIRVLGTTFNVLADPQENVFSTTLKEGSIRVQNLSDPSDVHLMVPGEEVTLVDGRLRKGVQEDPAALCWVDGLVNLKAPSFDALMKRFERVYGVSIVLNTHPSIEGLSGEIRVSEGVEHALKVLQHVVDFDYDLYGENILIRQKQH